jgi:starvation-inducible outer membrane lipoprotein
LSLDETVKMVKERDRKLGRLISTMSYNYPVLQVMGYRKMNKTNEVEVEPTTINIFDLRKDQEYNTTP